MIKKLFLLFTAICLTFCLSCKKTSPYDEKITQLRTDVFKYESDDFTLFAYAEIIETPILNDGIKGKTEKQITFKLKNKNPTKNFDNCSISLCLTKSNYKKDFEFKQIPSLLNCCITVDNLPAETFDATITINGESHAITLKSVKNKTTKSYVEVLKSLENNEDFVKQLNGEVELRIRLINNDGFDYWYVGIIDKQTENSFLIDGESLEIIAKREK